jgi:LysR family transcriptional regulator, cyn operon transcriptional activator
VHVTQSTLSHQIKQLEDELAQTLFIRHGKRVALTEAGGVFLGAAWRALHEVDLGLGALKRVPDELTGQVRIGATQTFLSGVIPVCLAEFLVSNPLVQVTVEALDAASIRTKLLDESLDLGIGYVPLDKANLLFEPLYAEEMVLLVAKGHPFARKKKLRMLALHQHDMVLLPAAYATRQMLDDCFQAAGAQPRVRVEMNSIAAMIDLVARTQLAAIISTDVLLNRDDVVRVKLENPTPIRTPGLLWKRQIEHTTATRELASKLRNYRRQ